MPIAHHLPFSKQRHQAFLQALWGYMKFFKGNKLVQVVFPKSPY